MNGPVEKSLRGARALLARPYGWGQGGFAQPHPRKPEVTCYCAMGALRSVLGIPLRPILNWGDLPREYEKGREILHRKVGGRRTVTGFNDDQETKKKDVLVLYDRAIAEAHAAGL